MGRDNNLTCKTCKKTYDLGYAPYSSWIFGETLAEFDKAGKGCTDKLSLAINQRTRKVLEEHAGHDLVMWSHDWCYCENGDLLMMSGYYDDAVLVEGFEEFEKIDMEASC